MVWCGFAPDTFTLVHFYGYAYVCVQVVERGKNERSSASICILNSFLLCFKSFCFDQFRVSYIGSYPHTAWVDFLQADGI